MHNCLSTWQEIWVSEFESVLPPPPIIFSDFVILQVCILWPFPYFIIQQVCVLSPFPILLYYRCAHSYLFSSHYSIGMYTLTFFIGVCWWWVAPTTRSDLELPLCRHCPWSVRFPSRGHDVVQVNIIHLLCALILQNFEVIKYNENCVKRCNCLTYMCHLCCRFKWKWCWFQSVNNNGNTTLHINISMQNKKLNWTYKIQTISTCIKGFLKHAKN